MVERIAKGARYSGSAVWAPSDAGELDELYGANERQHRALLDALAAGSPSGARALAREHVLSSGALLERILAQQLGSDTGRNRRFDKRSIGHLGSENDYFGSERTSR